MNNSAVAMRRAARCSVTVSGRPSVDRVMSVSITPAAVPSRNRCDRPGVARNLSDNTGADGCRGRHGHRRCQTDRRMRSEHGHHPHGDVVVVGVDQLPRRGAIIDGGADHPDFRDGVCDRIAGRAQSHGQRRLAAKFDQKRQSFFERVVALGAGEAELVCGKQRRGRAGGDHRCSIGSSARGHGVHRAAGGQQRGLRRRHAEKR